MSAQEHEWYSHNGTLYHCRRVGCRAQQLDGRWRVSAQGKWRPFPFGPCMQAPVAAPKSPILEAEWEVDADGYVAPKGGGAPVDAFDDWAAHAWAASPDMARALMRIWSEGHLRAPEVRAALLKAGVSEAELEAGA